MKFIVCFIFLFCVGCIKFKNKSEDQKVASVEAVEAQNNSVISYKILSQAQPNQFFIQFQWKPEAQPQMVQVTSKGKTNLTVLPQGLEWVDHSTYEEDSIHYDFGFYENNQWQSLQVIDMQRPRDLVIEGTKKWSDIKEEFALGSDHFYQLKNKYRIFFQPNAQLILEGQSLSFRIKEIFGSLNSEISTWPQGQTAANEKDGRSGGRLKIISEVFQGSLVVKLRGENGGKGKSGPFDPALDGAAGEDGQKGIYNGLYCMPDYNCVTTLRCEHPPTNGKPGSNGLIGHPGFPGFKGGSSGYAEIEFSQNEHAEIVLDHLPGEGGLGGDGGPGGKGGRGGLAGGGSENFFGVASERLCPAAQSGTPGQNGDQGPLGTRGPEGLKQNSYIKLRGQQRTY